MSRVSKEPCISPGIDDSEFTYSVSVATLLDITTANNRIDGVYILPTLKRNFCDTCMLPLLYLINWIYGSLRKVEIILNKVLGLFHDFRFP